jgi:plasmid maintenance system antidote protein VapI
MVNTNLLKGKIIEKGFTFKSLASAMNLSELTLRRKINNVTSFYIEESILLKNTLNISTDEYIAIFFEEKLEFNSDISI